MRAILLASAIAASFGDDLRASSASSQGDGWPRPCLACWITAVAPATSTLRNITATFTGQWVPRSVSHLGSIDPTISSCSSGTGRGGEPEGGRPTDLFYAACADAIGLPPA